MAQRHFAALRNLVAFGGIADLGKPSARQIYGFTALNSFVSLPSIFGCATMGTGREVAAQYRRQSRKGRD
jgi:hypothetical protein